MSKGVKRRDSEELQDCLAYCDNCGELIHACNLTGIPLYPSFCNESCRRESKTRATAYACGEYAELSRDQRAAFLRDIGAMEYETHVFTPETTTHQPQN